MPNRAEVNILERAGRLAGGFLGDTVARGGRRGAVELLEDDIQSLNEIADGMTLADYKGRLDKLYTYHGVAPGKRYDGDLAVHQDRINRQYANMAYPDAEAPELQSEDIQAVAPPAGGETDVQRGVRAIKNRNRAEEFSRRVTGWERSLKDTEKFNEVQERRRNAAAYFTPAENQALDLNRDKLSVARERGLLRNQAARDRTDATYAAATDRNAAFRERTRAQQQKDRTTPAMREFAFRLQAAQQDPTLMPPGGVRQMLYEAGVAEEQIHPAAKAALQGLMYNPDLSSWSPEELAGNIQTILDQFGERSQRPYDWASDEDLYGDEELRELWSIGQGGR